ncbi:MAG: 30S ribosomal protein S12 methylthiotransferase RimO [Acidimicrobiales bacterium]
MTKSYWMETLGCPKNQVDSDKLVGTLLADGYQAAAAAEDADLVVVNTCAFIEDARQESIDTVLELSGSRREGAELVVTGCLAERHPGELSAALSDDVDAVVGFGVPVTIGTKPAPPTLDLLNLPRPAADLPWAYVKIAEGCDRACGFCAIPTFRGPQRSRSLSSIVAEVEALGVQEVVLVAQDLASFGRDQGVGQRAIVPLVRAVADRVRWVRLLYLYPSDLSDGLIDAICDTAVPYFDLSLQHVSPPLLRRMRRWGNGERFLRRIAEIRGREPDAAFRSNFIVGYPGETEADHDQLLRFVEQADLDWCGFFTYSAEEGTYATSLDGVVDPGLMRDRISELAELQDAITAAKRDQMVGREVQVLIDKPGQARSHREAPEIDGVISVPTDLEAGTFATVKVQEALGSDLVAR